MFGGILEACSDVVDVRVSLQIFDVGEGVLASGLHDLWCWLVASVQAVDGGADAGGGSGRTMSRNSKGK